MITTVNHAPPAATSPESATNSKASALTSDFETFLRMLTAQARNQDPLEPLDSSEYASQLAQFSMVEQQVQTNGLLSELAKAIGANKLDQLSSWIGADVQATRAFQYKNTPVEIETLADPTADRAELVIRNSQNAEVVRIRVPIDKSQFSWDGADGKGTSLPQGVYSASLESFDGQKMVTDRPAAVFSRVVEAQIQDDVVTLKLDSGATVPVDEIRQIRKGA